jgi:hypothetical protein
VNDTIFATSFSDLFRTKSNSEILSIDLAFKVTFYKRKRLLNERIRDHVTGVRQLISVSELSRRQTTDMRIRPEIEKVKNRSPNVWRNNFVDLFHGPTKCRAAVKLLDQAS